MSLQISYTTSSVIPSGVGDDLATSLAFIFLEFDCVLSETHEITSTVTEHPVEQGADLSDHKRPGQRRVRLEGMVTNTPISESVPLSGPNSLPSAGVVGPSDKGANVLQFPAEFDRVRDMFNALAELVETAQDVTLTTGVQEYDNAQLIALSAPRTARDGSSITFTLDIVVVRVAETQRVGAPLPRQPRGQRSVNNGNQQGTDTEDNPDQRHQSQARRMLDSPAGQAYQEFFGIN